MVKVKICGITNLEDAVASLNAGADYLGLNFCPTSKRRVSPGDLGWTRALPRLTTIVGVFADEPPDTIMRMADALDLTGVQLHGDEPVDDVAALRERLQRDGREILVVKALRLGTREHLGLVAAYRPVVDYLLIDAFVKGQLGGTGRLGDWKLAEEAKSAGTPLILAGGLNAENVSAAVAAVRPFGVDVASGVERAPGLKDHALVKRFITKAKAANEKTS